MQVLSEQGALLLQPGVSVMPDKIPEHVSLADLDRDRRLFATVGEVASVLRWDPRTIRKLIASEAIPAVKADNSYRITVAWLRDQAYQMTGGAA
jgi:excisionase family DNA binding protein